MKTEMESSYHVEEAINKAEPAPSVATGDAEELTELGYKAELHRNRSTSTLLFQTLAIAAVPFAIGGPLINAIYGGGQLSLFVGWIICIFLSQCVALSISELASRYPTSAGPYFWSYQIASRGRTVLSYFTGWIWLMGLWTATLSVNFGFASMLAATITVYREDWIATSWQLLLIFYAIVLFTLIVCTFANRWLPLIDTICAAWTGLTIIVVLIALSVQAKAGRHTASFALGNLDTSFSGYGGFTFFIGLLPSAYTFSGIGMISAMAEESADPAIQVPRAISLAVVVEGVVGLVFILPLCFTMPPLAELITAAYGQALPVLFELVMGSKGGALGLLFLVLVLIMFCSLSITTAASRCTWAFARDNAMPLSKVWSRVDQRLGVPVYALILVSIIQMLLALINLGSSTAFIAFVSVAVTAVEVSYLIPTVVSLLHGRKEVNSARFTCGPRIGPVVNWIAVIWILFQLVLFSMPAALPVTATTMNYSSVVFTTIGVFSIVWYFFHARRGKSIEMFWALTAF